MKIVEIAHAKEKFPENSWVVYHFASVNSSYFKWENLIWWYVDKKTKISCKRIFYSWQVIRMDEQR